MADGNFWLSLEGRFMGVPQSISNYFLVCTGCDTPGSVETWKGWSLPCVIAR